MFHKKNAVLLLNADYSFLNTINVKRSLSLWAKGKAKILKSNGKMIHPELNITQPEVVMLKDYIHVPYNCRQLKLTREAIVLRDNSICQYSGRRLKKSEIEIDHVIPRSRGGKNTWENLVCSSQEMNNIKGNRTPEEAGMALLRKPFKPSLNDLLENIRKEEWSEYLDH